MHSAAAAARLALFRMEKLSGAVQAAVEHFLYSAMQSSRASSSFRLLFVSYLQRGRRRVYCVQGHVQSLVPLGAARL